MNRFFTATVPTNFDELMFLFWCDDESLESALFYRDESFLDLSKKISGSRSLFEYDANADTSISCDYAFACCDNSFLIPVSILNDIQTIGVE